MDKSKDFPKGPDESPRDDVDEASNESFPASDPPSWEPLHSGTPADERKRDEQQKGTRPDGEPPRGQAS